MLILEQANKIVEEILKERFAQAVEILKSPEPKLPSIEVTCADFDGVLFRISNPSEGGDNKNVKVIVLSIATKCGAALKKYGAEAKLKEIYGNYVTSAQSGYDFSIQVDLTALPNNTDQLAGQFALLKRHAFASPFEYAFKQVEAGNDAVIDVPFRGAERVLIKPGKDQKCTVIFACAFKDPGDMIIGKVFLTEFKKSISGAPSVDFNQKDAPGEIAHIKDLAPGLSFVSFVLFDRHYKNLRDKSIDMLIIFRNYLHYHIKCAKSHLHTRMRNTVDNLLKILNRAKQELPKEKTTSSGRTFVRSGTAKK